jgi:hypothetical protein
MDSFFRGIAFPFSWTLTGASTGATSKELAF